MRNSIFFILLIFLLCLHPSGLLAQQNDRLVQLEAVLDSMSQYIPALQEKTSLTLRDVSVAEYVRAVGIQHKINVYIPDSPQKRLTHSLNEEEVKSVFLFICKTFHYDIEVTGKILEFTNYIAPKGQPIVKAPKTLGLQYEQGKLSVDLKADSLYEVIRRISTLTGKKIVAKPGTTGLLTAFLPPTELDTALEALFLTNGFNLRARKKGYYVLERMEPIREKSIQDRLSFEVESFTDGDTEFISTQAENADLSEFVKAVFEQAAADYLIYDQLEGMISISAELSPLPKVLGYALQGTDYTYKQDGDIFLIGTKDLNGLQTTQMVRMRYRPTYQAIELIPGAESTGAATSGSQQNRNVAERQVPQIPRNNGANNFAGNRYNAYNNGYTGNNSFGGGGYAGYNGGNGGGFGYGAGNLGYQQPLLASNPPEIRYSQAGDVSIIDYPELNRIILKGPTEQVAEVARFLGEIDKPVPMVKIEMVVVEVNKDRLLSTGVKAGLKADDDTEEGPKDLLPGVNYSLDGSQLNALAGKIPALSNLGVLSDRFYLQLQAQESRGNLKVKMQPVLSMLNGREASLQIGQSQYYLLETQTASTGAVNNFQTFTQRFERIDANISLSLKPYISDDGTVTLDILPDFTTPVGQFSAEQPPTIATRRFVSTIRVKDGETVILGGLSEDSITENTRGLPLLSRIPVLKWIFGNVQKQKQKSSLIIYITPVIYYN